MLRILDKLAVEKNEPQLTYEALGNEEYIRVGQRNCVFYQRIEIIKQGVRDFQT